MAFCDGLLWNYLIQVSNKTVKDERIKLGPEEERNAVLGLLADDGLGETWKSLPLSASWSFWKDLTKPHNKVGMKTQDFAKHLQETGHFKTIAALDDIWQARTRNLRMFSNLRIFRDPIKPLWEVPQNREGGKFVIILNKTDAEAKASSSTGKPSESSSTAPTGHESDDSEDDDVSQQQSSKSGTASEKPCAVVPLEYKLCLGLMVLGLLGPVEQFCGCVLSIRAFGHMISIWVSSSTDDILMNDIRQNISLSLDVPLESITFQRHNESIRNNTRNLSKTETRKRMREARAKGDLMEPPQHSRPPRRKSESEKPVWGSKGPELLPRSSTESSATTLVAEESTESYATPSGATTQGQRSKNISRSLSGGGSSANPASSAPSHGQASQRHGANSHGAQTHPQREKGPISPRQGPTSPRSTSSGALNIPGTPNDASIPRLDAIHSDPVKKTGAGKRGLASPREKVHFQESVEIQTIYTRDAPGHSRGHVEKGRTQPPAPLNIPNINIMTGTPPSTAPIHQMHAKVTSGNHAAHPKQQTAYVSGDPEGWTVVGAAHAPNQTQQQNSSAWRIQPSSSQSGSTQLFPNSKKRRAKSASGPAAPRPDPNYVSPEALFGADLPLISPSLTPNEITSSSPPEHLDADDLAFIAEQHRLRAQSSQQEIAFKLEQLAVGDNSSVPSSSSATQATSSSSARRRSLNRRRNRSTDSETLPYSPTTATGGETSGPNTSPTVNQSMVTQN